MSRAWANLKDWDRESYRLEVANTSGVDLDEVVLPGDDNPDLNIILRNAQEAELDTLGAEVNAEVYNDPRRQAGLDEGTPGIEDMMLMDALDGNIDASWDVFGG